MFKYKNQKSVLLIKHPTTLSLPYIVFVSYFATKIINLTSKNKFKIHYILFLLDKFFMMIILCSTFAPLLNCQIFWFHFPVLFKNSWSHFAKRCKTVLIIFVKVSICAYDGYPKRVFTFHSLRDTLEIIPPSVFEIVLKILCAQKYKWAKCFPHFFTIAIIAQIAWLS